MNFVEVVLMSYKRRDVIVKTREEMLQDMMKQINEAGNVHLTEVAMPGVKASDVKETEKDQ